MAENSTETRLIPLDADGWEFIPPDAERSTSVARMESVRFTTTKLEAMDCPPGRDRIYYRDNATLGLVVCVTAKSKTFYVYRRVAGRPARIRLGLWPHELSVEDARRAAQRVNGQIADGVDPRAARRESMAEITFGQLFERHLEHAKAHNKTWAENQRQFDAYLSHWRGRRLSEISRADVQAWHATMGEKHGKYIANRTLALVGHMFAKTAANIGWDGSNPAKGVDRFREKSRDRFLQADELPRFFAALEEESELFRDFFLMLLMTGARRANVQAMRWDAIDFAAFVWRIPETKTGEPVSVPLVPDAMAILERRKLLALTAFVFPGHGKTGHITEPKDAWKRILARSGIKNLRIHDLRRTFGSWQAAAGVPLHTIGKSMGHKNQSTTAIYARLAMDPVREGVTAGVSKMLEASKKKPTE